jgi:hypothetical protein
MDPIDHPSINASDLMKRASVFSGQLVNRLAEINKVYPHAHLDDVERDVIKRKYAGELPGPTPESSLRAFESIFCAYIAARLAIEPA